MQTVLLTGVSGFIAKHCAVKLLNAGYAVRGSVRNTARADEVKDALRPHLTNPASLQNLTFVPLDLGHDDGWAEAMAGAHALMHTASPFPLVQPKNPEDLIRPAVDGTLRALRAAHQAAVGRVVLTSSSAAVMDSPLRPGRTSHDEADWSDLASPTITAYSRSKTMAERAAWDFVANDAPGMALTTINPTFVLGPALDAHYGTSLRVIERLLSAKDPMLPQIGFPIVDVRDVAEAHLRALQTDAAIGQRIIAAEGSLWFHEMAQAIRDHAPNRKIVTRRAPNALMRVLGLFDAEIRTIVPSLGKIDWLDNTRARTLLGIDFIPAREAVVAAADSVIRLKPA